MPAGKALSLSLGDSQHAKDHPGHVPTRWWPCLASFLEVLAGLDPQSGILGGASMLRAVRVRRALGQTGPRPKE